MGTHNSKAKAHFDFHFANLKILAQQENYAQLLFPTPFSSKGFVLLCPIVDCVLHSSFVLSIGLLSDQKVRGTWPGQKQT